MHAKLLAPSAYVVLRNEPLLLAKIPRISHHYCFAQWVQMRHSAAHAPTRLCPAFPTEGTTLGLPLTVSLLPTLPLHTMV